MKKRVVESTIKSWGTLGEALGHGYDNATSKPREIEELKGKKVVQVASSQHTLFLLDNGSVWSCGRGENGECGRQEKLGVPKRIGSLDMMIVSSVAVGEHHSLLSTSTGTVFAWGRNDSGQLGQGNREALNKPKLVKGALQHKHAVQVCNVVILLVVVLIVCVLRWWPEEHTVWCCVARERSMDLATA